MKADPGVRSQEDHHSIYISASFGKGICWRASGYIVQHSVWDPIMSRREEILPLILWTTWKKNLDIFRIQNEFHDIKHISDKIHEEVESQENDVWVLRYLWCSDVVSSLD